MWEIDVCARRRERGSAVDVGQRKRGEERVGETLGDVCTASAPLACNQPLGVGLSLAGGCNAGGLWTPVVA